MPRKTLQERGPVAAWLIESRKARGWTAERFLEELTKATGYAPTRPNYARWESGAAHPSEDSMARLTAFWQAVPDETAAAPVDPLAKAITALAAELRVWREEDRVRLDRLEAMVDRLAAGALVALDSPGEAMPPALRATAG